MTDYDPEKNPVEWLRASFLEAAPVLVSFAVTIAAEPSIRREKDLSHPRDTVLSALMFFHWLYARDFRSLLAPLPKRQIEAAFSEPFMTLVAGGFMHLVDYGSDDDAIVIASVEEAVAKGTVKAVPMETMVRFGEIRGQRAALLKEWSDRAAQQ